MCALFVTAIGGGTNITHSGFLELTDSMKKTSLFNIKGCLNELSMKGYDFYILYSCMA